MIIIVPDLRRHLFKTEKNKTEASVLFLSCCCQPRKVTLGSRSCLLINIIQQAASAAKCHLADSRGCSLGSRSYLAAEAAK
jgi:hypothetical protein